MIIYNITIKVDKDIAHEWLHWMIHEHSPEILATACFNSFTVLQILDIEESEGPTYAIQYRAENKEDYERYIQVYAPGLRQKSFDKWGNKFIAFRTLMKVVN